MMAYRAGMMRVGADLILEVMQVVLRHATDGRQQAAAAGIHRRPAFDPPQQAGYAEFVQTQVALASLRAGSVRWAGQPALRDGFWR